MQSKHICILSAVSLTVIFGQSTRAEKPLEFEVASVKPSPVDSRAAAHGPFRPQRYSRRGITLKHLIVEAYSIPDFQVCGGPDWVGSAPFDIEAKTEFAATGSEMMQMLGSLLTGRFQLAFHREIQEIAAYSLVVAKGGPKLGPSFHVTNEGDPLPGSGGGIWGVRGSMQQLAKFVASYLVRPFPSSGRAPIVPNEPLPVVDKTGLVDRYDITLDLRSNRDWFVILREQLGLALERRKVSVEMLVIDRVSRPSAN